VLHHFGEDQRLSNIHPRCEVAVVATPDGSNTPRWMLAQDEREALGMLAASLRGRMESLMQAQGFEVGTLRSLVREGLATADRGPAYFDPRTTVTMLQITDAGRRAIGLYT
jgi:hypothetical protein